MGFPENDVPPEWQPLTRAAFERKAPQFDALVLETPGIDRFCSSSLWTLPAFDAFLQDGVPVLAEHPCGMVALCYLETLHWGRMLAPLEASWCLASGLVTSRPQAYAGALRNLLHSQDSWQSLFFPGLEPDGLLWRSLVNRLSEWSLFLGPASARCRASLSDGEDGYLARRSAKFRKNLRRAKRQAQAHGIAFQWQAAWSGKQAEQFFPRR